MYAGISRGHSSRRNSHRRNRSCRVTVQSVVSRGLQRRPLAQSQSPVGFLPQLSTTAAPSSTPDPTTRQPQWYIVIVQIKCWNTPREIASSRRPVRRRPQPLPRRNQWRVTWQHVVSSVRTRSSPTIARWTVGSRFRGCRTTWCRRVKCGCNCTWITAWTGRSVSGNSLGYVRLFTSHSIYILWYFLMKFS